MDDLNEQPDATDALPDGERGNPGGIVWLPWVVIGVATAILVLGNMWVSRLKDEVSGAADFDQLVILKFQAKTLIGAQELAALQSQTLDLPGKQLREAVSSKDPLSLGAIATLDNFLRPEGDEELLEKIIADIDSDLEAAENSSAEADVEILRIVRDTIADPSSASDEEWSNIKETLGWFGKLLAASDGGPDHDHAAVIRSTGLKLAVVWTMGLVLVVAAGITGSVLLFLAIREYSQGDLQFRLTPPEPGAARVLLECFAVYLGAMAAIELLMIYSVKNGISLPTAISYGSLFAPVACALVWGLVLRHRHKGLGRAVGMHRGQGFFKEVGCGFVGYVAILPVVALGIAATVGLTMLVAGMSSGEDGGSPVPISHPIVSEIAKGEWRILIGVLLLASVAAPLFEEGLFRGAFHGGMRGRRFNFWMAALISAVIFAAIHPQGLMAIPALGAMGFGFSMLREWRGSLIAPMTAHAFHNGTLVLVMWVVLGG